MCTFLVIGVRDDEACSDPASSQRRMEVKYVEPFIVSVLLMRISRDVYSSTCAVMNVLMRFLPLLLGCRLTNNVFYVMLLSCLIMQISKAK